MKNIFSILLIIALMCVGAIAHAQQPKKVTRIGLLLAVSPSAAAARIKELREGLGEDRRHTTAGGRARSHVRDAIPRVEPRTHHPALGRVRREDHAGSAP